MVCVVCAGTITIGGMLALGQIGDLPMPTRLSSAICSTFLAFFGLYHTVRHQKVLHIDISDAGQFSLIKIHHPVASCQKKNWPHVKENRMVMRLLNDSTIWPQLLLLRLQDDSGKILVVPVLPDSVSRDGFRALSVACHWIAAHSNSTKHKTCE
jgi:hypothetical protein